MSSVYLISPFGRGERSQEIRWLPLEWCWWRCSYLRTNFAPWIAPQDPAFIRLPTRLSLPSHSRTFTAPTNLDAIYSRALFMARAFLCWWEVAWFSPRSPLGLIIGSIAGYYGGAIDRFVNVVLMNAFLSFPGILLAIAFVAFRGPGIFNLVLALSSLWRS